jgi:hypothetical protein
MAGGGYKLSTIGTLETGDQSHVLFEKLLTLVGVMGVCGVMGRVWYVWYVYGLVEGDFLAVQEGEAVLLEGYEAAVGSEEHGTGWE